MLGTNRQANKLFLRPNLPSLWTEYEAQMKFHDAVYTIKVKWESENTLSVNGKKYAEVHTGIKLKNGKT
ncbi:glycosyl hydrolase family 65 protein [Bartonella doshiae]|uniref:glycosyl hydrolase family 65 protein n=1 Tax=Bartonella doshiae TaxID=33044 RepID=UPI003CCF7D92